jgi:predicted DNA-binding protein (UPF0251 family)
MPRPRCCRRIAGRPAVPRFKPAGIPAAALEEIVMTLDEFEALRLADLEGHYQEQAAERMDVSRATFGRILDAAHRKVADVLVRGKALRIEGGPVEWDSRRRPRCSRCALRRADSGDGTDRCPRCRGMAEPPGTGTPGARAGVPAPRARGIAVGADSRRRATRTSKEKTR